MKNTIRALRRKLAEPYPCNSCYVAFLPNALFSGVFVFLFFFFIKPFGLGAFPTGLTNPLYAGYGLITVAMVAINRLIVPRLLRGFFREESWRVGREIIFSTWITLTVAIACYIFTHAYSDSRGMNLHKASFGLVLLATFFIGGLLCTLFILVNQNRVLRRNLSVEREANTRIDARAAATVGADEPEVVLVADNGRDTFRSRLADMLYIAAEENYVEIHYRKEHRPCRLLLRSSLGRAAAQVQALEPRLFRCHRGYIVNTGKIRQLHGNAQGFRLAIEGTAAQIPVSRRYVEAFRTRVLPQL